MDNPQEMLEQASRAVKFADLPRERFATVLDDLQSKQKQTLDGIKDWVEEGILTPLEGIEFASCITGQLFGYAEFHGSGARSVVETLATVAKESSRRTPVATH